MISNNYDIPRVSFSDANKAMVMNGKNGEKIELNFKKLRELKDDTALKKTKSHGKYTHLNVLDENNRLYRVAIKTKDMEKFGDLKPVKATKEEKKALKQYKKAEKLAKGYDNEMQLLRNKASPEELKRFDEIEAQIKAIAEKMKMEEENNI